MSITAQCNITKGDFTLEVDLNIPVQGITGLLGPSGCGKTTLLRTIAGLERCQDGYIKVDDMIWQDLEQFMPSHHRPLGYVFQEASLFPHLNVKQNLEYGFKRLANEEKKVSIARAIELLDIEALLCRKPDTLSGGERQRVAIARALAVSPRLLLMDEPMASLDIDRKQEILPYIELLQKELKIPVIYVSHAADEVARLADYLVLLNAGQVVATGTSEEMFTRLDLPLAHAVDAAAIIEASVIAFDSHFQLAELEFSGGRILADRESLQIGDRVKLRVAARDVSLTLQQQSDTSILNIIPATIDAITDENPVQVTVRLHAGDTPLLSRVTRKSATELDLKPGKTVYAQVKSIALLS